MTSAAHKLASEIRNKRISSGVVNTKLLTDERVIARVTDGIYRQPASALRELISNAYDADATEVFIDTDAPRFQRMIISDNGRGMTPDVLAHLLCHIGGSAKRTKVGAEIGITANQDSKSSPGGRRLIGKIGIGLFSVAQLTQSFQIISKVKGDTFRTIAAIALKTYTEEDLVESSDDKKFESGLVKIWSERADDIEAQGTTVILTELRPEARDTLRSNSIWASIEEARRELGPDQKDVLAPEFHIGRVHSESGDTIEDSAQLPWSAEDLPEKKFEQLVSSVWRQVGGGNSNPKLDAVFDYYLRMIWNLGLATPLPYVESHPFDTKFGTDVPIFLLSNSAKGSAEVRARTGRNHSARALLKLSDTCAPSFRVLVDGVSLKRPLKFLDLPSTEHALKHPLLFLGVCREEFSEVAKEISGGALSFEAYLFWTPKIVPREHRGALVRINGASGTLFDETFMRYQISELTRLSQITCEIFVKEGLDGALNIDRESFNYAHPHYVFLARWLHSALRQLATVQKKLSASVREELRGQEEEGVKGRIQSVVRREWRALSGGTGARPPKVSFVSESELQDKSKAKAGAYLFSRELVLSSPEFEKQTRRLQQSAETKLEAIIQILYAYGIFDDLPKKKQEKMLRAIAEVLSLT